MKLASIEVIKDVAKHPNADTLDIVTVLGYKCIVRLNQFKVGDKVVLIQPDTVLPDVEWAKMYKAKSNRVKAVKLRGQWSMGIVETTSIISKGQFSHFVEGVEVSDLLGITKYEPPAPQDLAASGPYGFGIPKTDEERYQNVEDLPWGEKVDVTLKIDGQSWSAIYKDIYTNGRDIFSSFKGIGGRSFLYKLDCENNYTRNEKQYNVLNKLEAFCKENKIDLCIRGEQYGKGIQAFSTNPHSQLPLSLAFYSTWLIDELKYARKGHPFYIFNIAEKLGLPTVPVLEKDAILTRELIRKYDEELEKVNGQYFEGVVINHSKGSFKVINKYYDSKK